MKHLLVALIILGILAVPIPIDKLSRLNESQLSESLSYIQKFFNIVEHCTQSEWVMVQQEDDTIVFVLKCMDKEA